MACSSVRAFTCCFTAMSSCSRLVSAAAASARSASNCAIRSRRLSHQPP